MPVGKIIKGIGGFYYVDDGNTVYECKARGNFRNKKITPLVGDNVSFTVRDNGENTVDEIFERKNSLIRPPLANLDNLFIVSSITDPEINTFNIDKLTAICEYKNIEPIIVITKTDLSKSDDYLKYRDIYEKAGFTVVCCDNSSGSGSERVKELMTGKISAFSGNTGVGKSSLLNNIFPSLNLPTGETSKKLGRGKHTTRHCELFRCSGGYIADTPGFSSLDFEKCETIYKEDLPYCFRDFAKYIDLCKFSSCSHISDKGCAVCAAAERGDISPSRRQSYITMYNRVKDIKEWQK